MLRIYIILIDMSSYVLRSQHRTLCFAKSILIFLKNLYFSQLLRESYSGDTMPYRNMCGLNL